MTVKARSAWVTGVLVACLSTGAHAYLIEPQVSDSFLGWSAKYKQFAVRREVRFTLHSQGRELPGETVEQPTSATATLPVAAGFTCGAFCAARGLKCSENLHPGDYRKHSVWANGYSYSTLDCSEPLVDRYVSLANQGKTMGRKADEVSQVICFCQELRQARTFTNFPPVVTLTLVEVYDASGALKRTFLEDPSQAGTLAKLRSDPSPVPEAVRTWVAREIIDTAGLLSAHLRDGAFTVARPSGKHPRGKCVVKLDVGKPDARGELPMRDVVLGVASPDLSTPIPMFDGRLSAAKVTFDAWWLPTKPSVLVGILKAPGNSDLSLGTFDLAQLIVVPASELSLCD